MKNDKKINSEKVLGGISATELLKEITDIVIEQQSESLRILSEIEQKLQKENIFIINEKDRITSYNVCYTKLLRYQNRTSSTTLSG